MKTGFHFVSMGLRTSWEIGSTVISLKENDNAIVLDYLS